MQLLGAWMMKMPCVRAFSSRVFMRGASSPSRVTAFLQWCRSHMSQTMIAVCFGCQASAVVVIRNAPLAGLVSTRFCKVSCSEGAAANVLVTATALKRHAQRRRW